MYSQSSNLNDELYPLEAELRNMAPASLKGMSLLSLLIAFTFWDASFSLSLIASGILLLTLIRHLLISEWISFRDSWGIPAWNIWFNSLALLKGFLWGIMNPIAISEFGINSLWTITTLLTTSGIAASSIPSLGPRKILAQVFISLVCLPIMIYFPLHKTVEGEVIIPVLFMIYWVYCWQQINLTSQKFTSSLGQSELLKHVIHNIPLSMSCRTLDGEKRFTFINKAAEKVWGLKQDHLGKSPDQIFPPEVAMIIQSQDGMAREYSEPVRFPEFKVQLNGQDKILTKTTVYLRDSQLILDISEDISHLKKAEIEITELQAVHFQAAKMATLGEMAAGVAHEINNPLAIIMGKAESLKRLARQASINLNEVDTAVERIVATTRRISKIVQGLLAFAKSGDSETPAETTAQQVLQFALNMIQKRFDDAGIRLEVLPFDDVALTCQEQRVAQSLMNLLSNSFDAIHKIPGAWVEIMVQDLDQDVGFSITDCGPPIPTDVKAKMMMPFFTTKEVGKGTGLGLSVVKGVVEEHGGEFYLNEECEHTQFVLILPKNPKNAMAPPTKLIAA